jgi:hypothetical protein
MPAVEMFRELRAQVVAWSTQVRSLLPWVLGYHTCSEEVAMVPRSSLMTQMLMTMVRTWNQSQICQLPAKRNVPASKIIETAILGCS